MSRFWRQPIPISPGRSAQPIDDRNVLITFEPCGHSEAFSRADDGVLSPSDVMELLAGVHHDCEETA